MSGDSSVSIQVPGKWVLTGEHSVLRGASAVAMPHPEFSLKLKGTLRPSAEKLHIFPSEQETLVQSVVARALELQKELGYPTLYDRSPGGELLLESSIPQGAGFGSSAALCVAIARLLEKGPIERVTDLATRLEDRFHGKSSGMDVHVAALAEPILYRMGKTPEPLRLKLLPRFTFHDTGFRGQTRDCIATVQDWIFRNPKEAPWIDQVMAKASEDALTGLRKFDSGNREAGLQEIADAMKNAQSCFRSWGLSHPEIEPLENSLKSQGALAVKLTGAGKGGFLVALWKD